MDDDNPLEYISKVTEFNDLSQFMQDEDLDAALNKVIKIMVKPDVPSIKVAALIVELQAYAAKFSMLATVYATIQKDKAGTPNNYKKNIYYSAAEALDKVVQSLKYVAKTSY